MHISDFYFKVFDTIFRTFLKGRCLCHPFFWDFLDMVRCVWYVFDSFWGLTCLRQILDSPWSVYASQNEVKVRYIETNHLEEQMHLFGVKSSLKPSERSGIENDGMNFHDVGVHKISA